MQAQGKQFVYHGGAIPVRAINPKKVAGDGELLCTSRSVNVARRYGPVISRFVVNDIPTKTMSIREWLNDVESLHDIRKEGYSAVLVIGDVTWFDFPADMLVVLEAPALSFDCVLSSDEMLALRDDFSEMHAPDGPAAIGWDLWLSDLGMDLNEALSELGWTVADDGSYSVKVRDSEWRDYIVVVSEGPPRKFDLPGLPATCWSVENNWGGDSFALTLADALRTADQWRRDEITRRADDLARTVRYEIPAVSESEVDALESIPF